MLGALSDIDDIKKIEQELRSSRSRFRTAINSLPFDFFVLDDHEQYVMQNIVCKEHYGDLIGKTPEDIAPDENTLALWKKNNRRAYSGETVRGEVSFPIKGKFHYFYNIISPIFDGNKQSGILGVNIDITEMKKAQAQVQELLENENERLKAIDDLRLQFIANATHELKTPLMFVHGTSKFLLDNYKYQMDDAVENLIHYIRKGSERLKRIIEDFLDVTKIESGKMEMNIKESDIALVAKDALNYIEYLTLQRNLRISHEFPESLKCNFDVERIQQVMDNLFSNAIKNTPEGGHIMIRLEKDGDNCLFSVEDDGIGITDDEMPQLFKQFGKIERDIHLFQIDLGGTGIGLFLSKAIIDKHGGKIWAESEGRNEGATFKFAIPLNNN